MVPFFVLFVIFVTAAVYQNSGNLILFVLQDRISLLFPQSKTTLQLA